MQSITFLNPNGAPSETYPGLHTNLLYTLVGTVTKAVVVTSPDPTEGKSTVCANLAVVLAQSDKSTLVIDCNLRKPVVHRIFELCNFAGVVNALVGERSPQEVWQEPLPGLEVITAGSVLPNPGELLGSRCFTQLLECVRGAFDYVLIDASPTEPVSDPPILAAQGD